MIQGQLTRIETSDHGTFGILDLPGFRCHVAEPPWRDNAAGISCIPPGQYLVEPWSSKRFPRTFHLTGVPGREAVLIHSGNLAGDAQKGMLRHTMGCLLPGLKRGWIGKQKAVLMSLPALNQLRKLIGRQQCMLEIGGNGPWNG